MKTNRLILMIFLVFFLNCTSESDFVRDIPLSDVKSHIDSLQLLNESDIEETSTKYLELLSKKKNIDKPQIYFFLHLLGNDTTLQRGLDKFPDDPYLNFMKVTSMEEGDLKLLSYMTILDSYPHHEITLNDLILHTMDEYNKTSSEELKQKLLLGLHKYFVNYRIKPRGVINGYDFSSTYNSIPESFREGFKNNFNVVENLIKVTLQKIEKEKLEELSRSPVGESTQKPSSQGTTIEGVYYQKNNYGEYTTEIKNNGTYVYKSYENGEETYSKSGRWKIITVEKKSLKKSNSYDLIVFDNKTCLEITNRDCLSGVSNEVSNIIMTPKYNLFPSDGDFLSSMNMWSPIQLSSYQRLCYDDELSRN